MSEEDALKEKRLGNAAYEKRDFPAAISHYEKAISLDSTEMVFHNNLAAVYLETEDFEKCIRSCETAMEVGRVNGADSKLVAKVMRRLASAHRKMGNLTVAEAVLEKAIAAGETVPDHRSPKSAQPEDGTDRMRAEMLRKEKELMGIKRKILDVQIAEAREQMNMAPPAKCQANNKAEHGIKEAEKTLFKAMEKEIKRKAEENSNGDERQEAMSTKKLKQSFAEKLSELGSKMFLPKAGEDSDSSDEGKEQDSEDEEKAGEDSDSSDEEKEQDSEDEENVITFKVFKYGPDDPSPYVNLSDVESDVSVMLNADEIVVPEDRKSISVVFDYPLKEKFVFELDSPRGKGFTRGELVTAIGNKYKEIYKEEEETSTLPVETMKERSDRLGGGIGCNLVNRAQTEGKYGIWGHELGDLALDEVIFSPEKNLYYLEISS